MTRRGGVHSSSARQDGDDHDDDVGSGGGSGRAVERARGDRAGLCLWDPQAGLPQLRRLPRPAVRLGKATFLGTGRTADPAFCLVLRKERKVPCLYRPTADESGYSVPGEVFAVDADALRALDILEGIDEASYYREELPIELLEDIRAPPPSDDDSQHPILCAKGQVITCHVYLKVFSDKLTALENVPEYTAEAHVHYKSRPRVPKLRILECIYGPDVIKRVQEQLDQGLDFDEAWRRVVVVEA